MLIMPVLFIAPLPPRFDPLFDLAGSGENRHVSRPGSLLAIAGERAPEREERQSEVVTSQSLLHLTENRTGIVAEFALENGPAHGARKYHP